MLANRDSWYMSPITELGRPRPDLFPTFAALVEAFKMLDPPSLEKLTDTAVTINVLERASRCDKGGEDVLEALYAADIDYEFFDVETGRLEKPLVLYTGGRWLSRAGQQRLASYVESGGSLVFFQSMPLLDDALQSLNLLGLVEPTGIAAAANPQRVRLGLGARSVELSSDALFTFARPPGEPLVAERIRPRSPRQEGGHVHVLLPVGERLSVGYVERRGKGRLIVLGVAPSPELVVALHAWLGVRVACRALSPGIQSAAFKRGSDVFIVLTNTRSEMRDARLSLDLDLPVPGARDLRTGAELTVVDDCVVVPLAARSGTAIQLYSGVRYLESS
jgi:hypothetical protein